ncbi:hypothetical protein Taro_036662 [Colocasia esculenta]|uniref:C2H2-type domain-containing protein n=1 Tax=Colocasia esculenta TaxID=4460 RepID=A0A843WGZ3_COLES|nr:hypothetical protein [Colocasia esculenta]
MEFSSQAREGGAALVPSARFSSGTADGYFDARELRAGYVDMADEIRRTELTWDAVSDGEVLQRELIKGRIRGEIILRELARVRLLEEEVRRELEMERALAMRKPHNGLVSSFGVGPKASDDMVVWSHLGEDMIKESVGADRRDREDLFGGQMLVEKRSPTNVLHIDHEKASPVSVFGPKIVEKRSPTNVPHIDHGMNSAVLTFSANGERSTAGVGGIKRRACELLPGIARKKAGGPAEHDWSCAICQVSVTSRETLNEHLKGRRHKANAELMGIIKKTGVSTSTKRAAGPSAVVKDMVLKVSKSNVNGKHPLNEAKGISQLQKQQKAARLWCELCKVECNSDTALATHLGGKKHRTKLRKSKSATRNLLLRRKEMFQVQSSEARDEVKAESPSTDEVTGVVEDSKVEKAGIC